MMPRRKKTITKKSPQRLAGQPTLEAATARMIRVNHAGEFGAQRIYAGQLAVLKNSKSAATIRHMADQEDAHLRAFEKLIATRRVRPTALQPLWHIFGYLLGAGTASMGEKAAMACTVAVEEVIDEHYRKQIDQLQKNDPELLALVKKFRAEELEHRDIGRNHGAEDLPYYRPLRALIRRASKTAIWLSERI
jgi:3-demethoxyubiquinol 3-hydroxylase